jgi:hypothetical protein
VAFLINKSRCYDALLQKRCYTAQILLSILGVIDTNAVILPKFYKNKIRLLF